MTLGILISHSANERAEREHLKWPAVYYTVATEVFSIINSTSLYLDKVLCDLAHLMGSKQFAYQMEQVKNKKAEQRKLDLEDCPWLLSISEVEEL